MDFYVKDGKGLLQKTQEGPQEVGFHRQCTLRPATVLYPVTVSNSTIRLRGQMLDNEATDFLDVYKPAVYHSGSGTTWLGYASTLAKLYATAINVSYAGAVGYTYARTGLFGTAYLKNLSDLQDPDGFFDVSFRDPTADVLSAMRELTFRMALAVARKPSSSRWLGKNIPSGTNTNTSSLDLGLYSSSVQPFNFSNGTIETRNVTLYQTDGVYGGVGIAWTLMLALIAPTFCGFWLLDRKVSLSLLETAKAFRSPLLEDVIRTLISMESLRKLASAKLDMKRLGWKCVPEHPMILGGTSKGLFTSSSPRCSPSVRRCYTPLTSHSPFSLSYTHSLALT